MVKYFLDSTLPVHRSVAIAFGRTCAGLQFPVGENSLVARGQGVRGMKLAARVTLAMMLVTARRERGDCAIMYIITFFI